MPRVEALPETRVHEHEPRDRAGREALKKRSFLCTLCGYGVFRSAPPERCPMCQADSGWIRAPKRWSSILVTA